MNDLMTEEDAIRSQASCATREGACVYALFDNSMVVLPYINSIIIEYVDAAAMVKLAEALHAMFDAKYLGDITWFLRMRIKVDAEVEATTINQFQFATERILYNGLRWRAATHLFLS
ncbi:hypothetical protein GN244_ATG15930 [Phytophthora infestans]|uniref:Uncharacterized protein n=1 Tax=Phytophthora infestans TaxID=4787 RepID=A0A833S444_PHYIN|nr:hypothetical protein GN244_ATG15930 [Phytophthora infestans]KAF4127819.1 hypothetical protein GN958_ATG23050 [Phytophthora infestans]